MVIKTIPSVPLCMKVLHLLLILKLECNFNYERTDHMPTLELHVTFLTHLWVQFHEHTQSYSQMQAYGRQEIANPVL